MSYSFRLSNAYHGVELPQRRVLRPRRVVRVAAAVDNLGKHGDVGPFVEKNAPRHAAVPPRPPRLLEVRLAALAHVRVDHIPHLDEGGGVSVKGGGVRLPSEYVHF